MSSLHLPPMHCLLLTFAAVTGVTLLVTYSFAKHGHLSAGHDLSGPQKSHARPVPRIGGAGIYVGLCAAVCAMTWRGSPMARLGLQLLACGLPAFVAGLVEALTKRLSPGKRLLATGVSGLLGVVVLGRPVSNWYSRTGLGSVHDLGGAGPSSGPTSPPVPATTSCSACLGFASSPCSCGWAIELRHAPAHQSLWRRVRGRSVPAANVIADKAKR